MYTREDLGSDFGPYEVQIADYNLSLKDGTRISTRPPVPKFKYDEKKCY